MSDEDSFEEKVRALAREVGRSLERAAQVDIEQIADAIGVDPARASALVDGAMGWLRNQAEAYDFSASWGTTSDPAGADDLAPVVPAGTSGRTGGPHPLDLPTDEQGLALAALDSGRWTVEPGSHTLAHGEGPRPRDAGGLVGELRARDWIAADGTVTLAGRHALTRWLDGGRPT